MSFIVRLAVPIITLFSIFLFLGQELVLADSHLQPIQHEIIDSFTPLGFNPGAVMAINGGPFYPQSAQGGSALFLNDNELSFFYESNHRIIFVVPLTTACGWHKLQILNTTLIDNEPHVEESNVAEIFVSCLNLNVFEGPKPAIKKIIHSGHVTAGLERIYIEGNNILPYDSLNGFPHTIVHYQMDNIIGTERLKYESFGRASFTLNVDQCGTYKVTFRNYYIDERSYSESGRHEIDVVNGCDSNVHDDSNRGNGKLELVSSQDVAQIDEPHEMILNVDLNWAFPGLAQIDIFVNGVFEGAQQISIAAHEIQRIPLVFHFREAGTNTVEIRMMDFSVSTQVDVLEPPGTTGSPSNIQNFSGNLADFDADGDCILGELEFFEFMDAWLAGVVDDVAFFDGVDAWVEQANICPAASASASKLEVRLSQYAILFSASNQVTSMKLSVYDAQGREVFAHSSAGNRLAWNMKNHMSYQVANGVYFARVSTKLVDGSLNHEIKKIAVVR